MRWLGRLVLLPFGLLLAVSSSSVFLLVVSVFDPVMAELTGGTLFRAFWSFMDAVSAVDDPTVVVEGAATGLAKLFFTLLVLPPAFIALTGEVIGTRQLLWYAGGSGLLTGILPWLVRGVPAATRAELHIGLVLALTGAIAGLVYWMVAGRRAGTGAAHPRAFSGEVDPVHR